MDKKILNTLQALLRCQEGEERLGNIDAATRFSEKVQHLLRKHSLSMSDVESSNQIEEINVGTELFTVSHSRRGVSWHRELLGNIAKANDCEMVVILKSNAYNLVGTETNRKIVKMLFVYFMDLAVHLANKQTDKENEDVRFRNSFLYGFASSVGKRMLAESEKLKQQATQENLPQTSQALMRISDSLVKVRKALNDMGTQQFQQPVKYKVSGFKRGQEIGNAVALTNKTTDSGTPIARLST